MSFLPMQKLTIGELFVSIAAGLMLFLLPGDAKNQFNNAALAQGYVFVFSLVISAALLFTIKRYEALGAAMLTDSILTVSGFLLYLVNGIIVKGNVFWAVISEYQLITMFISWIVPFFLAVTVRLLRNGLGDTSDSRMRFSNFLVSAIRSLMIIYILVIVCRHLFPYHPHLSEERNISFVLFGKITECLDGSYKKGTLYLFWHSLILAPLSFSLLILNPKIKSWHLFIICLCTGLTLEVIQFALNTGTICIDDILLYMIGGAAGFLLKHFIDLIRSAITSGQDRCMLSFSYTLNSDNKRTKIQKKEMS